MCVCVCVLESGRVFNWREDARLREEDGGVSDGKKVLEGCGF